jgi:DNA-binding transcriptional ArsR family regulator
VRILAALMAHGELSVTALCDLLSMSQPAVGHHLLLLRMVGLLQCRWVNRFTLYRIGSPDLADLVERGFMLAAGESTLNCRGFSLIFKRRRPA